jgi:hypothetical protein
MPNVGKINLPPCHGCVHVTLVICASAISVFSYPQFYFSIMRIINILSVATAEAAAQAI